MHPLISAEPARLHREELQRAWVAPPCPQRWQQRLDEHDIAIGDAVLTRRPITATISTNLPDGGCVTGGPRCTPRWRGRTARCPVITILE
jgi:hypothetical protein